jgi:hypothetical protein
MNCVYSRVVQTVHSFRQRSFLALGILSATAVVALGAERPSVAIEQAFTLAPTSLSALVPAGAPAFDLAAARANGLAVTDSPSVGSGLDVNAAGEWFGLTDRGPNSQLKGPDGKNRRVLPLPTFAPGIVQMRTNGNALELVRFIPLRDAQGRPLTGIGNTREDENGYLSATSPRTLTPDPGGVDPEGLHCLPDGGFLVSDEYGPSLLRVDVSGRVLWRLIPKGHALPGAPYSVRAILPAAVRERRKNRGFENLALSADGRTAYLALQSTALEDKHPQLKTSRIIRMVEVDVSDVAAPRVTGHFLARAGAAADHAGMKSQGPIKWNDLVWLAPRTLLVLEQGNKSACLREVNLTDATNLLGTQEENNPRLDAEDPEALRGLQVAEARFVADLTRASEEAGHKLEGLVRLGPGRYALANDNDFGIGDNETGLASKVWVVQVAERPE